MNGQRKCDTHTHIHHDGILFSHKRKKSFMLRSDRERQNDKQLMISLVYVIFFKKKKKNLIQRIDWKLPEVRSEGQKVQTSSYKIYKS